MSGSSRRRSGNSAGPDYNTLGLAQPNLAGSTYRRMNKAGKFLQQVGFAQIANAPFSMPDTSGKIWTPVQRNERKTHRPDIKKKDIKKYDWRPKGNWADMGQLQTVRGKARRLKSREAHWARRPIYDQGIYSQPTPNEIDAHRASQSFRGKSKVALGTGMRFLGRGLLVFQLGVYASWLYDDPSDDTVHDIVKDLTFYQQIEDVFQTWQHMLGQNPTLTAQ